MLTVPNPRVAIRNNGIYDFCPKKPGDVGHDLYVSIASDSQTMLDKFVSGVLGLRAKVIWPFSTKLVGSCVRIDQPNTVWCHVVARSSAMKKGLMVIGGIIDSGYQGELFAVLYNFSLRPRIVKQGERYAQVIFHEAIRPQFTHDAFRDTDRGATGFGSSGR